MREFYGNQGNTYFIMNFEYAECYAFDRYGSLVSKTGFIKNIASATEVNVLSVISDTVLGGCDIYFDGYHRESKHSYFDVISKMIKYKPSIGGRIFSFNHEEEDVRQSLLVYPVGVVTRNNIDEVLEESYEWMSV